jgi:anaerobic selenocysteine-containing dehydrogenase
MQRSQILLASLTGNLGRPGGGWRSGGFVELEGLALLATQDRVSLLPLLWLGARLKMNPEGVEKEFLSHFVSSTLFHTVHGGLGEVRQAPQHGDPTLPRPPSAYLEEALAKGHFPVGPPPGAEPPEVVFSILGNILRHSRMGERVRDTLFAKAGLIVHTDFRISETARHADIVLPAAGWYEKVGLKYILALVPYVTLGDRAVPPLGESKPEWEIFSRLAERVAAEARRRGVREVQSFRGQPCNIANLDERFSDGGRFGPDDDEAVVRFILSKSSALSGITLEDLRREGGAVRLSGLGPNGPTSGTFTEYRPDEPVVSLTDFTERKRPYATLTGRQQFYVDHPWFLELGEELPVHKDPPAAGGQHPLTLTSSHTRWSIHATWRDQALMLRLQRGGPVVYLNEADARERGIGDHDWVRLWNDLGSFVARAKPSSSIRPGQAHIYHAWEPFQFPKGKSHQSLVPSPLKPTQLVGDYGHLHWSFSYYEPNAVDRDTRVNVSKL